MKQASPAFEMTLEELTYGSDNHVFRLKNSALQERHVDPSWQYAGPHVCDDRFLEVDFAPEAKRQRSQPRDYLFTCIYPREQHSTSGTSVHADLTSVAKRYGASVNEIHSFMRFPPVGAVVRTLLIELESPKAQPGRRPDEVALVLLVNDILSETTPLQRQRFLTQTTVPGPDFAGRALVMCLVKLYAQFESWNFWHWGSGERRSVLEVLVSVVGLFCNAWINAPEIDASWARLGSNITSPISLHGVRKVEKFQPSHLTPEVCFLPWTTPRSPKVLLTFLSLLSQRSRNQKPIMRVVLPSAISISQTRNDGLSGPYSTPEGPASRRGRVCNILLIGSTRNLLGSRLETYRAAISGSYSFIVLDLISLDRCRS